MDIIKQLTLHSDENTGSTEEISKTALLSSNVDSMSLRDFLFKAIESNST